MANEIESIPAACRHEDGYDGADDPNGCNLNVTVGQGEWSDKIGAGALGWFIAWPLAVTAGVGA